jgi:hypothetical protein
MNTNKQQKNILAVIAGILFTGLLINTVNEISPTPVMSNDQRSSADSVVVVDTGELQEKILEEEVSIRKENAETKRKVDNVRKYLEGRKSPLADYAEEIVKAADTHGIDYRLIPAISIIESSGGIHNFRSYNAWGWGKRNFSSWEDGIWTVTEGLARYYARGMDTPQKMSRTYCPPNAENWARKVTFVMNQIGN